MPNNYVIPELINNFNAYQEGNRLIGITGAVSLAEFENLTETISGAGLLGEFEAPALGHFASMEQEVPFRVMYPKNGVFSYMNPSKDVDLTLRGSVQVASGANGATDYVGMRVVFRGRQKKFKPGKLEQGKMMECSTTLEITYVMIEIDGQKCIELDKINSVYVVNGVDLMQKVKSLC